MIDGKGDIQNNTDRHSAIVSFDQQHPQPSDNLASSNPNELSIGKTANGQNGRPITRATTVKRSAKSQSQASKKGKADLEKIDWWSKYYASQNKINTNNSVDRKSSAGIDTLKVSYCKITVIFHDTYTIELMKLQKVDLR